MERLLIEKDDVCCANGKDHRECTAHVVIILSDYNGNKSVRTRSALGRARRRCDASVRDNDGSHQCCKLFFEQRHYLGYLIHV